ncbi:peptidase M14 (plasmid) [Buttiauxella sp. 3AFRM03]|uniref:peptidase M14 n=1 Tax=Buttiauxella sp. 3AFRM03 TaxID=2479367 RepID=UPI000EF7FA78|nr:peptidase M14 [Buttiauxella sp. 3AFRM03]AYN25663.1 peptidase M14 [Buttiauxella sp. 3AFRM03]AYN25704.1 peptidase M14 [Buttiauxella sp. 3AFRM03]
MAVEWVDVADNAVKIGLGSFIALLGGGLTLKLTQQHELKKDTTTQELKEKEKKTERYIKFLALSQSLMQTYLYKQCEANDEGYLEYLRIHNEITITSSLVIRKAAFKLQYDVSTYILYNKDNDPDLIENLREVSRDSVSMFQAIVNEELCNGKFGRTSQ